MKSSNTIFQCFLFFFFMGGIAYAQKSYTAETKLFIQKWQKFKQKSEQAPSIEYLHKEFGLRKLRGAQKNAEWVLPIWLSFSSEADMETSLPIAEGLGFVVQTKLKTICTGLMPLRFFSELGSIQGIVQVQAARKGRANLDMSRKGCKTDSVQMGVLEDKYGQKAIYRGEGVIVGIVDGGFDYTHPNFYDPDSAHIYRVKRVWDQTDESENPPSDYDYGVEYTSKAAILNAKYSEQDLSHGTHVAGIAAGSGAGTIYQGMAPKADLVFVRTDEMCDVTILDGVQYVKNYAKKRNQACAVNLSIGMHSGPHDGSSAFDRALDEMKSPGFIVVGSAGNEGASPLHISHNFTPNTCDTLFYTFLDLPLNIDASVHVDAWSTDTSAIEMAVALVKKGEILRQSSFVNSSANSVHEETLTGSGKVSCQISIVPEQNQYNHKHRLFLELSTSFQNAEDSNYLMLILKSRNTKKPASLQMWSEFTAFVNENFIPYAIYNDSIHEVKMGQTNYTVGEIGGTSKSILSVGSYATRNSWVDITGKTQNMKEVKENDISYFSSKGPTADGRIKPDITAPGQYIISSFNSFDKSIPPSNIVEKWVYGDRDYYFGSFQGTSMSSPAATGIMALWLQAHPNWQIDSVKKYIAITAINDSYTGNLRNAPSNTWGYGKLDAFTPLRLFPGNSAKLNIESLQKIQNSITVYPNPNTGNFHFISPMPGKIVEIKLVDINGQTIYQNRSRAEKIEIKQIQKGFYLLQASVDGTVYTSKVSVQ